MATVTHYIYSHYDPKNRETLQIETGQVPEASEANTEADAVDVDPWETEFAFGVRRRIAAAPRFVPAIVPYDQVNKMMGLPTSFFQPRAKVRDESVSGWYRSLARSSGSSSESNTVEAGPSRSFVSSPAPFAPESSTNTSSQITQRKPEALDKNNWFISKIIRSDPPSGRSTPSTSLADILSRDPPPEPTEKSFKPPVFLAIGPSNKGFTMLEQSGWSEGEALGAGVARRQQASHIQPKSSKGKAPERMERQVFKTEEIEFRLDGDGEVCEVRHVEVVDLTLSDSEEELEEPPFQDVLEEHPQLDHAPSHNPTALLTPIATVLKSDRLGIGLKAKTVGPYKESKKRVTHNAAALAAHIKANEEMKKMKKLYGRGSRGFARIAKAQAESRKRLLASLNEG